MSGLLFFATRSSTALRGRRPRARGGAVTILSLIVDKKELVLFTVGVECVCLLVGHHFDVVDVDVRWQGDDPFNDARDVVASQRRNTSVYGVGAVAIAVETDGRRWGSGERRGTERAFAADWRRGWKTNAEDWLPA